MDKSNKVTITVGPLAVERLRNALRGPNCDPVSACNVAWLLDCDTKEALDLLHAAQEQLTDQEAPYFVDKYGNFMDGFGCEKK